MKTQTKKKKTAKKKFDAVKMMREIRDKLTQEIMGMTYEQEKEYLRKLLTKC